MQQKCHSVCCTVLAYTPAERGWGRPDISCRACMVLPQRRGKAPASLSSGRGAQRRSQLGPAGGRKGVAKPAKRKPVSLKNQIRGLERLLRKVGSSILVLEWWFL